MSLNLKRGSVNRNPAVTYRAPSIEAIKRTSKEFASFVQDGKFAYQKSIVSQGNKFKNYLYAAPPFSLLKTRANQFAQELMSLNLKRGSVNRFSAPDVTVYVPVGEYQSVEDQSANPFGDFDVEQAQMGDQSAPPLPPAPPVAAEPEKGKRGTPAYYQAPNFQELQARAAKFAEQLAQLSFEIIPKGTAVTVRSHVKDGFLLSTKSGFILNKDGNRSYTVLYPRYNTQELETSVPADFITNGFSRVHASKVKSTKFFPKGAFEFGQQHKACKKMAAAYAQSLVSMKHHQKCKAKALIAGSTHSLCLTSTISAEKLNIQGALTAGCSISANFCGLGWRNGTILSVNTNGTFNILYMNGAKEVHVSPKKVRGPSISSVSHSISKSQALEHLPSVTKFFPNGTAVTVQAHMKDGFKMSTKSGFILGRDGRGLYVVMYPRYNTQEIEIGVSESFISVGFSRVHASKVKSTKFYQKSASEFEKQQKICQKKAEAYAKTLDTLKNQQKYVSSGSITGCTHSLCLVSTLSLDQLSVQSGFAPGSAISANFCGLGWRSGTILSVNSNGTYNIIYNNGAKEVYVSPKKVQIPFSSVVSHSISKSQGFDHLASLKPLLTVGAVVMSNFCGMGWRPGRIDKVNMNNSYNVNYDHGAREVFVSPKNVRLALFPEVEVEGKFLGMEWRKGHIESVNSNGTFNVKYIHGAKEVTVSPKNIKLLQQNKLQMKKVSVQKIWPVGYPVCAKFCGMEWRAGRINKVNENGSYNVLYDHGAKEIGISSKSILPLLFIGCHVSANFCGMGLKEGVIESLNENNTFNIEYSNGAREVHVSSKQVSLLFTIGTSVLGKFCGMSWKKGKIVKVNSNGTFDLAYENGAMEVHVARKKLRLLAESRESVSYASHQISKAQATRTAPITPALRSDSLCSVSSVSHVASDSSAFSAKKLTAIGDTFSVSSVSHVISQCSSVQALCVSSDSRDSASCVSHIVSNSTSLHAVTLNSAVSEKRSPSFVTHQVSPISSLMSDSLVKSSVSAQPRPAVESQLKVSYICPPMSELKLISKQHSLGDHSKYYVKTRVLENPGEEYFNPKFGMPVIVKGMQGSIELVHEDGSCTVKFEDGHIEKRVEKKVIHPRRSMVTPRANNMGPL